ncbi:MAG: hypothetical protein KDB36_18860, partial [Acidimicrobiales bacterium]|nr:hypothetical protein [Acidimicrobiales bacterium]
MDRSWRARARRTQRSLGAMCLLVVAALVAGSLVGVVADTATAPPAAAAGTCKDWVATGSEALWTDGANWSPAGVPGATDCIRSQSVTDMLVDTNVSITFWQQSEFLNTVRITNDAAFRLTSTEFGSTINEVVGESGELIADNTTSTRINRIVVPAANTFTIGGPSPITIGGGFVAGTLRVGKTATTGVGARNADVSMSLATLLPGDVVVDGPSLGRLRLTGSTPNTGLGGDYQGSITNGAKGATTLAVDARLTVKDSQTLQITGPFTVESTVDGSGGTVDVDAGGRVTFDAGLTNYAAAADALTGGRWDVGGRIDLPGPLMANRADVIYRGGDFFHANAVTRPTRNERLLRIASDMTFAGLLNLVGPLAKTPVLIVGTDVTEPYVPTTLTVTNPGLQSQAGGVVE